MSARTGKRRAAVLVALGSEPKKISQIAKEAGLKWQVVRDILDAPSMTHLVEFGTGVSLASTPEAMAAQQEARELLNVEVFTE